MKNRELYLRDPSDQLPNLGVSQVGGDADESYWKVLEWELDSFVCEGSYEQGLDRILGSFLSELGEEKQPPAWVSGFYGSGKSHLVKVLAHLWADTKLPSGASARGTVTVSSDIAAHLKELSTQSKRAGGVWAASGHLSAAPSGSVRLALLNVLYAAAGLPENHARASFVLWLDREGIRDEVEGMIRSAGRDPEDVYRDLYVSDVLANALHEAKPDAFASPGAVGDRLETQYPPASDISEDEFLATMDRVLRAQSEKGELPLTLLVLDEMQQFIAENEERALDVQGIVEACSSQFGQRVLIVATGQTALTATPVLSKLHDRFPVRVELEDRDVETVVREVVLRKKPETIEALQEALDAASGEIDRHLDGSRIGAKAEDKPTLVPDHPVLPTRRRLWEKALRGIDKAGKSGVLRSQLRIVHDAAATSADEEVGTVVGADFLYGQQTAEMLNSGALLNEVNQTIQNLDDGTEDGSLKSRICRLVFLISKLEREGINATGVRPVASVFADLLVEDLQDDGAVIRKRVPELLEELVEAGTLMPIDDEYQLQTSEGAEWTKEFQARKAQILGEPARMSALRTDALTRVLENELIALKVLHGNAKVPRPVEVTFGAEPPVPAEGKIGAWVRGGWDVASEAFEAEVREAGADDATVFIFTPRSHETEIREALAAHAAAQETLSQRAVPQTDEGKEARKSIQTLAESEDEKLTDLFGEVLAGTRVFMGGGEEVTASELRDAVAAAGSKALARIYPKFGLADHAEWSKAGQKARDGAPDALKFVGFDGEPVNHPVCKAVLAAIPTAGITGAELRKEFTGKPYGWPQDAVNSALLVLVGTGNVAAKNAGVPVGGAKEIAPSQVGVHTFFKEDDPPSLNQRMAVRNLLTEAGVEWETEREGVALPALFQHLRELAGQASGAAPLPDPPSLELLDGLAGMTGNHQLKEVADSHGELKQLLQTLGRAAGLRSSRMEAWAVVQRLLAHAVGLDASGPAEEAVGAIASGRHLLDDPDPVAPVADKLADALRLALKERVGEAHAAFVEHIARLEESAEWKQLEPEKAEAILAQVELTAFEDPDVSTLEALLGALDKRSLKGWSEQPDLCRIHADKALTLAIQELEPETVIVNVPRRTIATDSELEEMLDELRGEVTKHLSDGGKVAIQ